MLPGLVPRTKLLAGSMEETIMPDAAAIHSPRVVGELRPDCHSLEAFLASPRFAGKQGEALVLALYDLLISPLDGVWHGWPMNERQGDPVGWGDVSDPVKLLNAYGWTICGQNALLLQGLYRAAGMPCRLRQLPGHVVCEVAYDDRWHVLDADMRTWFRTPDGHIAGVDDLVRDPRGLILDNRHRSSPCSLPDRPLEHYAHMYEAVTSKGVPTFPDWATRIHSMDFTLRPGETLIRSQVGDGRFHMPATWREFLRVHGGEWPGQPRERFEPFRTIGNGRWIYAPNLSVNTRDVELGAWTRDGLGQDEYGLLGPGSIVFRMQSPYPFCGIPNQAQACFPASDGVWLELAGSGALHAEVSDAEGRFVEVAAPGRCDLTALMASRYGALIRLTLGQGARLSALRFDGRLMTAPMSLPRLVEGENRMSLRTLDRHGQRTTPWTVPVDFRSKTALSAALVRVEAGSLVPGARERLRLAPPPAGPACAVFRFAAPAARSFAWAYAIATVPERPTGGRASQAVLEWSPDGSTWKTMAAIDIPGTPLQWDASLDGEAHPTGPQRHLWLRVTSATGLIGLEFAGHLAEPASPAELRITHRWYEAGGERAYAVPSGDSTYAIPCGSEPRQHSIEMRAPSLPR